MVTARLPPIDELKLLFMFDSSSATLLALGRGPGGSARPACVTQKGRPCVYINGRYWPAAQIAWAVQGGGATGDDQHIACIDGSPFNLRLENLRVQDVPPRYRSQRGRTARRPTWQRRDIRRCRESQMWQVWHDGTMIGEYHGRQEAIAAYRKTFLSSPSHDHS